MLKYIFACYYAFSVKTKRLDPAFMAVAIMVLAEVVLLTTFEVILGQFITVDRHSFWRSKPVWWGAVSLFAVPTYIYFYKKGNGDSAWQDYSALSARKKYVWIAVSLFVFVGPLTTIAILAG